jgi:6-phosphogluconolactonase (cycloisomerase 2 family)
MSYVRLRVSSFLLVMCLCGLETPLTSGQHSLSQIQVLQNGQGTARGLRGAQALATSPDGRHVYVASGGDNAIGVYKRDSATGRLDFVQTLDSANTNGVRGISSLCVSPDGLNVYSASLYDREVIVFQRDLRSGVLRPIQTVRNGLNGIDGMLGPAFILATRDNGNIYIASYVGDALFAFKRDTTNGRLTLVEVQRAGVSRAMGVGAPIAITESDDGKQIYLVSSRDFCLSVFSRDPETGRLDLLQIKREGISGVRGLGAARALVLTPDGAHLYLVGAEGSMAIFRRDATSGELTFLDSLHEGVGGVQGLAGANGIATSPDGNIIYVASGGAAAVNAFHRDLRNGSLSRIDILRNGIDGVTGLAGARSLVVSPDGSNVYVVSAMDNALTVFRNIGSRRATAYGTK